MVEHQRNDPVRAQDVPSTRISYVGLRSPEARRDRAPGEDTASLRRAVTSIRPVLMHVVWLETSAPSGLERSSAVRALRPQEIYDASLDPALDLEPDFVRSALAKGDRCFGVFERHELVSYAWYAGTPTKVGFGLSVSWTHRSLRYMYKGFTRPQARGRGLYSVGLAAAARTLAAEGDVRAIFAFIGRHNRPSQAAAARVGYRRGGTLVMVRPFTWAYVRRGDPDRRLTLGRD